MKVAVTGTSGLIGSAVAACLSREAVVARIGRQEHCDFRVDLTDLQAVAALDLSGFDALVHCAGVVDEDFRTGSDLGFRLAVGGASALLDAARRAGVSRIAYISSAHVYGPLVGTLDESSSPDPRSDYAIAHFATEQIFKRQAEHFRSAGVFRPCAVFGELPSLAAFRRWSLVPFAFPRSAALAGEIVLKSTGDQRRNLVDSADIARMVETWVKDPSRQGFGSFNCVGASSMSIWELAELCAARAHAVLGRATRLERVEPSVGQNPPERFDYETLHAFCRGPTKINEHIDRLLKSVANGGQ